MTAVFADTCYWLALLNSSDPAHAAAKQAAASLGRGVITTWWVLVEVADAMSAPANRGKFALFLSRLRAHPAMEILSLDDELLGRGVDLYAKRPDKAWSLTDCIPFVVMAERNLTDALTHDHHFEQAGFRVLLAKV